MQCIGIEIIGKVRKFSSATKSKTIFVNLLECNQEIEHFASRLKIFKTFILVFIIDRSLLLNRVVKVQLVI